MSCNHEQELSRLSKDVQRMRSLLVLATSILSAVFLFAAQPKTAVPHVIRAERIVLLDSNARERLTLEVTQNGNGAATLRLANKDGHSVVVLDDGTVTSNLAGAHELAGPELTLWDPKGKQPLASLRADANGGALNLGDIDHVSLSASASGQTGAILSLDDVTERKSSTIHAGSLSCEDAESIVSATATGGPHISIESGNLGGISLGQDKDRFQIDLYNCQPSKKRLDSGKEITLCNPTPQMLLSISPEGPSLRMDDREGFEAQIGRSELILPKTGKRSVTSAASMLLFDNHKNVLWSAP